ncbi:hypothetical protein LCGC14_1464320 [marine sediment metagenome]|uniref:Uncharacterized protein n=1 Tax=marine sediment metagenome TaxID=412755 RepID=A0A0F9JEN8_9ZZZZ
MPGAENSYVWLAYLLCTLGALACVIWGLIAWNRPAEQDAESLHPAAEQPKAE